MTLTEAIILGIVEGLTEFVPVSSTGHLNLVTAWMGLAGDDGMFAFTIVIQLGAILAVLGLYRQRVKQMTEGLLGKDKEGLELFKKLLIAFFPAVIVGLLFEDAIEAHLASPFPIALALIFGGILMISVESIQRWRGNEPIDEVNRKNIYQFSYKDALFIGFMQCLALWPGTSRSMSTIVGAQMRNASPSAAAEFSFLLALPTLGGATVYKLLKDWQALTDLPNGLVLVLVGNVVAFVVAAIAVYGFIGFVKKYGMTPFGYYRIAIGLITIWAIYAGVFDRNP